MPGGAGVCSRTSTDLYLRVFRDFSDNWLSEMSKFCPALTAVCYYGPQEQRFDLQREILSDRDIDVVLTTFVFYFMNDFSSV